jgi:hypothetical protein
MDVEVNPNEGGYSIQNTYVVTPQKKETKKYNGEKTRRNFNIFLGF